MTTPPIPPEPQQPMQPPVMPFTPFQRLPTDTEPLNAAMRRRRLGNLINSAKFEALMAQDPTWAQTALVEYEEMRAIEASAQQAAAAAAQPQKAQPQQPEPTP